MPYPPREEVVEELLMLLHDSPDHWMPSDATYAPLAQHFGLTSEERVQTRNVVRNDGRDEPEWHNQVQWARERLRKDGYLRSTKRGIWQLSSSGEEAAAALGKSAISPIVYPDDVPPDTMEGAKSAVVVNRFERSRVARSACISHYGTECRACGMNFESVYGQRGKDFIHVHHIVPIATIKKAYRVNPITDLRPVCANCHAMLHRTDPPCTIEELSTILKAPPTGRLKNA